VTSGARTGNGELDRANEISKPPFAFLAQESTRGPFYLPATSRRNASDRESSRSGVESQDVV